MFSCLNSISAGFAIPPKFMRSMAPRKRCFHFMPGLTMPDIRWSVSNLNPCSRRSLHMPQIAPVIPPTAKFSSLRIRGLRQEASARYERIRCLADLLSSLRRHFRVGYEWLVHEDKGILVTISLSCIWFCSILVVIRIFLISCSPPMKLSEPSLRSKTPLSAFRPKVPSRIT